MREIHMGTKHPLSGADTDTFFDLYMIPSGYQTNGEGDYGYLVQ